MPAVQLEEGVEEGTSAVAEIVNVTLLPAWSRSNYNLPLYVGPTVNSPAQNVIIPPVLTKLSKSCIANVVLLFLAVLSVVSTYFSMIFGWSRGRPAAVDGAGPA